MLKQIYDKELVNTAEFPYGKFPFEKFNPVQSAILDIYDKPENCIVAAATSSGKTIVGELFLSHETRVKGGKGVYLSPLRALTQEKISDWAEPNHHFNDLKLSICTGDYQLTAARKAELDASNLVLLTSEMLNSLSRANSEKSEFLKQVGTVVIDECHLLTVPNRGDHLEAGIMAFTKLNPSARIVCLSATMANVDEIGNWLEKLTGRDTYLIKSDYRPCPLKIHYISVQDGSNGYMKYDEKEACKVEEALKLVKTHKQDKFLLFVHTKKTGNLMYDALKKDGIKADFHYSDLTKEKRIALEKSFKEDPDFRVVVATSTLAWGCCVKGTKVTMADGSLMNIEDMVYDDKVLCMGHKHHGDGTQTFVTRKVVRTGMTEKQPVYTVTLKNGMSIRVGGDHKLFVVKYSSNYTIENLCDSKGYFEVRKLGKWDMVATYTGKKLFYSRVVDIEVSKEPEHMYDIEVQGLHNYISDNMVSHNCNLPARRVVILGVHRGLSEVETYDIHQAIGRSGRPKYDPQGDAYVLLPASKMGEWRGKLKKPCVIKSQMIDLNKESSNKTLAFHIVSEIHHGSVKNKEDVQTWYSRTLASFQDTDLKDSIIETMIESLKKKGVVKEDENGQYTLTPIGKISSMFYYSPYDVADLCKNFNNLFLKEKSHDDHLLSIALANIDSNRQMIVSAVEAAEMDSYNNMLIAKKMIVDKPVTKMGFCYYLLLNGTENKILSAQLRGLQFDFGRVKEVIGAIDTMNSHWDKYEWLKKLSVRIAYGVTNEQVDIVALTGIGKVKAEKLWKAGLKDLKTIGSNKNRVKAALSCSDEVALSICQEAKVLSIV